LLGFQQSLFQTRPLVRRVTYYKQDGNVKIPISLRDGAVFRQEA